MPASQQRHAFQFPADTDIDRTRPNFVSAATDKGLPGPGSSGAQASETLETVLFYGDGQTSTFFTSVARLSCRTFFPHYRKTILDGIVAAAAEAMQPLPGAGSRRAELQPGMAYRTNQNLKQRGGDEALAHCSSLSGHPVHLPCA